MSTPALLRGLSLPVMAAPLFIVSEPGLVIAQCRAGIVGSFPALNARPQAALEGWLDRITRELAEAASDGVAVAPYAVNQIIHTSNDRLAEDMAVCARFRVPLVITSLSAPTTIVPQVHAWGGLVFHDVISIRHARKAIAAGVDGLILVCAGAGGHAGTLSPFALLEEVRRFWSGPVALAGGIASGRGILAAQVLGADFAYMGTRFIATAEARAAEGYKAMLVDSTAADIVYTPFFTGIHGNYLRGSIAAAGYDPDKLPSRGADATVLGSGATKAWRDIWGAGQGVGQIDAVRPVAELVGQLRREYDAARSAVSRPEDVSFPAAR